MKKLLQILLAFLLTIQNNCFWQLKAEDDEFWNGHVQSIKKDFDDSFEYEKNQTINIDGTDNQLLLQFASNDDALKTVVNKCSVLINVLSEQFLLNELSEETWMYYRTAMNAMVFNDVISSEADYEYRYLRAFFDIYENKYKNEKVINALSDKNDNLDQILMENLPSDSEYVICRRNNRIKNNETEDANTVKAVNSFSLTNAISYASTWATSANTYYYRYFYTGDCANFVSQILEAGGQAQNNTGNVNTGWWHTRTYNSTFDYYVHTNSNSWSLANNLVNYFGVIYSTYIHSAFAVSINVGSVIAADWTWDGDWDHVGFVTAKDSSTGNYNRLTYYDYKVAQHTADYHAWTSSSTNNWEYIGSDGGRYGKVYQ